MGQLKLTAEQIEALKKQDFSTGNSVVIREYAFPLEYVTVDRGPAVGNTYAIPAAKSLEEISFLFGGSKKLAEFILNGGNFRQLCKYVSDSAIKGDVEDGVAGTEFGTKAYYLRYAEIFTEETSDSAKATTRAKSEEMVEIASLESTISDVDAFLKDVSSVPSNMLQNAQAVGEKLKLRFDCITRLEEIKKVRAERRAKNKAEKAAKEASEKPTVEPTH